MPTPKKADFHQAILYRNNAYAAYTNAFAGWQKAADARSEGAPEETVAFYARLAADASAAAAREAAEACRANPGSEAARDALRHALQAADWALRAAVDAPAGGPVQPARR